MKLVLLDCVLRGGFMNTNQRLQRTVVTTLELLKARAVVII